MRHRVLSAWGMAVVIAGCSAPVDPLAERAKSELAIANQESEGISIEEAIAKSKEEGASPESLHWIRGKIGSSKGDTFVAKSSEFLISEIPKGEHASSANHDPENCPFCRAREAKAPTVLVRLVGKDGKPFPRSAEKLLALKKGQHVLLRGQLEFDADLNYLNIEANGLQRLE